MKKILNAIFLALVLFIILNFLYSNMTAESLGYPMVFRFKIPGLFTLRSVEMPLGFVLIVSFSLGLLFLAFLQAIPAMFRDRDSKRQQKRIKELEKEVHLMAECAEAKKKAQAQPEERSLISDS